MIVRVRAGTTLAELSQATAGGGQFVALEAPDPARATVGGVLSTGLSGPRRLGWGPVRDAVLEVTAVTSQGELIRAGAPLVKNVTGFDLCRILVGSVGTLALLAEVVLRCRPRAEVERWWCSEEGDPWEVFAGLYRPLSVMWDGTRTWVGLSGYRRDVEEQAGAVLRSGYRPVDGPPVPPGAERRSLAPAALRDLARRAAPGGWLAEIGVGVVHCDGAAAAALPAAGASPGVVELHRRIKERFDPSRRLAPGRSPLGAHAGAPAVRR